VAPDRDKQQRLTDNSMSICDVLCIWRGCAGLKISEAVSWRMERLKSTGYREELMSESLYFSLSLTSSDLLVCFNL
jgi:hypothetical protein